MRTIPSRILVINVEDKVVFVGDTYKSVADRLNVSVSTVKSRIYDGHSVRGYILRYESKRIEMPEVPIIAIGRGGSKHYKCVKDASDNLGISESTIICKLADGSSVDGYFFDFDILGAMA